MTDTLRPAHPVHPGAILRKELRAREWSSSFLTDLMYGDDVYAILEGDAPVTADIAQRLARAFGTSPEVWMNLQRNYDEAIAPKDKEVP